MRCIPRIGKVLFVASFSSLFIGEDHLECSTSMLQFIDPLIYTLANFYECVYTSEMSRGSDPRVRQAFVESEPASVKQLDNLSRIHPGHTFYRRMSQDLLDVRILQKPVSSPRVTDTGGGQ